MKTVKEVDAQFSLGQLIDETAKPDAIHIAISPAIAAQMLVPGQHIGFMDAGNFELVGMCVPSLGIVDPFLTGAVKKGERFWMFLYPNTITSLRHHWTHPAFNGSAPVTISNDDHKIKSAAWIAQHAHDLGLTDDVLMGNARTWLRYEDHQVQQGSEHWRDTFNAEEFWHHYEIVTGEPVPNDKKHSFYCCSC